MGGGGVRFAEARDLQRVEHAVARILSETDGPVEAYAAVLEAIGSSLGWELGAVWEAGPDDERLRCLRTWHAGAGAPEFEALSERIAQGRPARSAFTSVGATTALLHGGAAAGPADAGAIMKRPQARVRQWASSASLPWAWLSGPYTGSPVRS